MIAKDAADLTMRAVNNVGEPAVELAQLQHAVTLHDRQVPERADGAVAGTAVGEDPLDLRLRR